MPVFYRGLINGLAAAGAFIVAAMVVLITVNVVGRALGTGGIRWTDEVSEYGLYAVTLLAAPWLLERGAHIRVDVLLTSLPPRLGWALEVLADLIGTVTSLVVAWVALQATMQAARFGNLTIKTLVFPEWWLLAPLPLAFALIAVVFTRRLVVALAGPRRPTTSDGASLF